MPTARISIPASLGTALLLALGQPAPAVPPSANYKLVFADEFLGTGLDTLKWGYNYSWGHQHNHQAYMDASQVKIAGGVLDLEAITQRHPNAVDFNRDDFGWQVVNYTSGAVHSANTFRFTRGYVEARMKMDDVVGAWPAFWMLSNGWPPEIDIMEFPRSASNSASQWHWNLHYRNTATNSNASEGWQDGGTNLVGGYNTFGMEWTGTTVSFYLNGTLRRTLQTNNAKAAVPALANMYLILNNAVGGWPGDVTGPFNSHFWTDYVRVYQLPEAAATTLNWSPTTGSGSWDTLANWGGAMAPKYEDVIASFGANNARAATVSWSNSRTVGGLAFDSVTEFTIGGGSGSLQFARSSGTPTITIASTNAAIHALAARVELYDSVQVNNHSAAPFLINGRIVGPGSLTKSGAGVLLLSGQNSFTGGLTFPTGAAAVDHGTIRLLNSQAAGTGTISLPGTNASRQVLELSSGITIANPLTTGGRSDAVFLRNYSGANAFDGNITIIGGGATNGLYAIDAAAGSLTLRGSLSTTATDVTTPRYFDLRGAAAGTVAGTIIDGRDLTVGLVKSGTGVWTLSAQNSYSAGTTVADGTLRISHPRAMGGGSVAVTGGTLDLQAGLSAAVVMPALTVSGSGVLQIHNNGVVLNHSPGAGPGVLAELRTDLFQNSIATSLADLDPRLAIGYGDATLLGLQTFRSVGLDGSAVVMLAALKGDSNLDGTVNFSDLLSLAKNYGVGTAALWTDGDTNYDGAVGFADLLNLAKNYNTTLGSSFASEWATALASVPEPAGMALSFSAAALLTARRRRRA